MERLRAIGCLIRILAIQGLLLKLVKWLRKRLDVVVCLKGISLTKLR